MEDYGKKAKNPHQTERDRLKRFSVGLLLDCWILKFRDD